MFARDLLGYVQPGRLSRAIADRGPARTAPKSWSLKPHSRSRFTHQQEGQIRGPTMMPRTCGQVAASSASRPAAGAACLKDGYYTTLFLAFSLLLGWLFYIFPRLLRLPCAFSVFLRCTSIDWISGFLRYPVFPSCLVTGVPFDFALGQICDYSLSFCRDP